MVPCQHPDEMRGMCVYVCVCCDEVKGKGKGRKRETRGEEEQ